MAKMIPSVINRDDPRRNGEYMVYDWLSSSDIPGVCFYSLPQKNHKHKMIGEVDFLYISEKGMLCIEVKGGQEIYRQERNWYSVNRKGEHISISDPFIQSRNCMYALGGYIENVYGKHSTEHNLQRGYCVVFPECIAKCKGNDIVSEVMFDNRFNLSDFGNFLSGVLDYWHNEEVKKHFGYGSNRLSNTQVKQMVDLLQADFGSVPSMKLEIQNVEEKMLKLSDEQMDIIDDMHENKKLLVQGAAGTGKSLLALEKARQSLAQNKRVLYLCYNKNMSKYAKNNLPDNKSIVVKTFHALMNEYLEGDVFDLSIENLCSAFGRKTIDEKFDILIIDEGQDLMYESIWPVLDSFIEGGLSDGEWVVFTDPNQSIFTESNTYDNGVNFLKELFNPTVVTLSKNWRNTLQIGRRTARITSVPPAKHMKIDGPKVVTKRKFKSKKEIEKQLRQDINALIVGGVNPKDIVILSSRIFENSSISDICEMSNLKINSLANLEYFKNNEIKFFTVQSYKGLESPVVFYIDIPGFKSLECRQLNYVAMSRAKALLYMYINDNLEEEYNDALDG